jgi:hypothetical protein
MFVAGGADRWAAASWLSAEPGGKATMVRARGLCSADTPPST